MAAPEPASARERCSVHPDRSSVGRCESCGRPSCLSCAVPFRGRLLCQECASRELGAPPPPAPVRRQLSRRPEIAVVALLGMGLLATIAPWHRSGPLTEALSAWQPGPQPWPLVACICLALAAGTALASVVTRFAPGRLPAAYAVLAALAAAASVVALAASPDYTSPTPAPFAALGAAAAASAVGFARLRRGRP